ncbi:hypothetical protein PVAND_014395 [Polypedilum vanderplanki]|uniref:Uncharacterized protein n=1 Tax=Polypedilum vanderplanki TaxID=319348 RepID=A0A9J6B9A1_POLVA|nr:hypothetical protein PVAND_014395 [Polypedilum vanderplanki]
MAPKHPLSFENEADRLSAKLKASLHLNPSKNQTLKLKEIINQDPIARNKINQILQEYRNISKYKNIKNVKFSTKNDDDLPTPPPAPTGLKWRTSVENLRNKKLYNYDSECIQ